MTSKPSDATGAGSTGSYSPAWAARVLLVRLRFPLILALVVAILAGWETISTHAWRLMDRLAGHPAAGGAVAGGTEYYCPMDPGVISDWPSKCPICNMALVRRQRGDMSPLPDGVLARVNFTPDRLQLAGVATAEVRYRPLERSLAVPLHVEAGPDDSGRETARLVGELFASESGELVVGMPVRVELADRVVAGRIEELEAADRASGATRVRIALSDNDSQLTPGPVPRAIVRYAVARVAPFRDQPREAPPRRSGEPIFLFGCAEHADVLQERPGKCPRDQTTLMAMPLSENERTRWWCPMHPEVVSETAGATCSECGGMRLVPRVVSYAPPGEVLAVPESAVIDTGLRKLVYVERMPGTFDGVPVVLGPRCGDAYPVVSGLSPHQRVVAAGAFLVDAETRLNPGLAATYFGAGALAGSRATSGRPTASLPKAQTVASKAADPAIARQGKCPVTGLELGSMGPPLVVQVRGRTVYICCEGCRTALEAEPDKYLARLTRDETKQTPAASP